MSDEDPMRQERTVIEDIGTYPPPIPTFFSRFSLAAKLIVGFAAISLIGAMIGVAGLYFLDRINNTLNNITDIAAPTVETSDDLIALILEANKVVEEIIADEDIQDIDALVVELGGLHRSFTTTYLELEPLVLDESLLDELHTAKQEHKEFVLHSQQMIDAHVSELTNLASSAAVLASFDDAGTELTAAFDEFAEENEAEMAKAEDEGDRLEQVGAGGAAVNHILGQLFDQDYPVVESALKIQRLIIEMQDTAGEYIAETNPAKLTFIETEFISLYDDVQPHMDVLRTLTETEEEEADIRVIEGMFQAWVTLARGRGKLFDIHKDMLRAETSADQLADKAESDADNVTSALDRVAEVADAISDGADEAAEGAIAQARAAILALLALALVISVILISLIMLTAVRPIRQLTQAMILLGKRYGTLSPPAIKVGDEVRQLWETFNHMAGQLAMATDGLEMTVQKRTAELRERTAELDSANQHLEAELIRRQSVEQQLVHAQKLDALGRLSGGIAHDFNNMLYVILGCTRLALQEVSAGTACRDLLGKINQAAERSKSIVNQILFFSRSEPLNQKPLNLGHTVRESITLLRAALPPSSVLEMDIDRDCDEILADETQIQQLVVNLATNAFQALPQGKGVIQLSVQQADVDRDLAVQHVGLEPGSYACLAITDQGCGIPEAELANIYDPFFTTKPVGEGTGLGLAVVHGIVTAHGGVITVSSELGIGTSFVVYLPLMEQCRA